MNVQKIHWMFSSSDTWSTACYKIACALDEKDDQIVKLLNLIEELRQQVTKLQDDVNDLYRQR